MNDAQSHARSELSGVLVQQIGCNEAPEGSRNVKPLLRQELEALNPGIRETVQLLRAWGFDTRDSGDGQTAQFECDLPIPYVHIATPAQSMASETDRLVQLLKSYGVCFDNCPNPQVDPDGYEKHPKVEASYLPLQYDMAFIHVFNVILKTGRND